MNRAFAIAALLTGVLLSYALYQALVIAPTDLAQGNVYRIIFAQNGRLHELVDRYWTRSISIPSREGVLLSRLSGLEAE
jgi:hypothetical protein